MGIFTIMFLMQYFSLHGILPFSKSYRENESTWSIAKWRRRKSFDTWYYIVTCATLCVSFFYQNRKQLFFQNIFWNRMHVNNQFKQERNCFITWQFLIKIESTWRRKIKEQALQLILLYRGNTVRSSQRRCCIRKLFLNILQYPQETPVLESIFKKVADL